MLKVFVFKVCLFLPHYSLTKLKPTCENALLRSSSLSFFFLLAKRMDLLKSDAKFTLRNKIIYKIVVLPFFLTLLLLNILQMEIMYLKLHFRCDFLTYYVTVATE